jgi:hypothetical protein
MAPSWRARWAVLGVLLALSVSVTPAHAGPDHHHGSKPHLRANLHVAHAGQQIVVRARSSLTCGWILTWPRHRKQRLGHVLVARFRAPTVTRATKIRVRATCLGTKGGYGDSHRKPPRSSGTATSSPGVAADPQAITATIPRLWKGRVVIIVLPAVGVGPETAHSGDGHHGSHAGLGNLADTGGPGLLLLILGLISTLVGVLLLARRREDSPEDPPTRATAWFQTLKRNSTTSPSCMT